MKHNSLEQQLEASRPNMPARSAFTARTMDAIRAVQAGETFDRVLRITNTTKKEYPLMKLRKKLPIYKRLKPGYLYASLAGVAVVGSTAAAVALWPTPKVTQTTDVPLPSGNHIVGYDTHNCNYFAELKSPVNTPTHDVVYYEIRKGANLTDQQLESSLQAVCEENLSNNAIGTIAHQIPKVAPGVQSSLNYIVKAISAHSITVALDPHYSAVQAPSRANVTFTNFADNLLVYDESSKMSYSDLKVGNSIVLVIATTLKPRPNTSYSPFTTPSADTIYGIMAVPPLTGDPNLFYTAVAKDLVRANRCKSNPNGFCEAYGFATSKP